jgi:hypothetical protein
VLRHYEDRYPEDKRPREAIQAALKWAKDPTEANRVAAIDAAYAAADASSAAYAAADAYAAYAVAADARKKEREWQSDRLLKLLGAL